MWRDMVQAAASCVDVMQHILDEDWTSTNHCVFRRRSLWRPLDYHWKLPSGLGAIIKSIHLCSCSRLSLVLIVVSCRDKQLLHALPIISDELKYSSVVSSHEQNDFTLTTLKFI